MKAGAPRGSKGAGALPAREEARRRRGSSGESSSSRTPLASGVLERGRRVNEIPFHVPGHLRGRTMHPIMEEMSQSALAYDTTELKGLDYLSNPSGVIQEAQELASEAFGADRSWFLVNGTTVGIHAAIMSVAKDEGDAIVVSRDCHQSAFSALVLSGARPVWVKPEYDERFGFATLSTRNLRRVLADCDRPPAGVLVVSPNYFGLCANVAEAARACHDHGVPLLVDEAHGSHFAFHDDFPPTALSCGADIAIQSTHKTLSAMTQASLLHAQGDRVSFDKIGASLQMLQSSSPSYLLMSSIDTARAQAVVASDSGNPESSPSFAAAARNAARIKRTIAKIPGVEVLGVGNTAEEVDPLRLTLTLSDLNRSGFAVASILEETYGIVPELATDKAVVFVATLGTTVSDLEDLAAALREIAADTNGPVGTAPQQSADAEASGLDTALDCPQVLSPRQAFFSTHLRVELSQAVGKVCAEIVSVYPPGIPILYPGEEITQEAVGYLLGMRDQGGKVLCSDASLSTLLICSSV